jgi:hypothetical protein
MTNGPPRGPARNYPPPPRQPPVYRNQPYGYRPPPPMGYPPPVQPPRSRNTGLVWTVIGTVVAIAALVIAAAAWLYPDYSRRESSDSERRPYIVAVDALCVTALREAEVLGDAPLEDPKAYGRYLLTLNGHSNALLQGWSALDPPERDVEVIRTMLDTLEAIVFETQEAGSVLARGETQVATPIIGKIRELQATLRQDTRAYGFEVCSRMA